MYMSRDLSDYFILYDNFLFVRVTKQPNSFGEDQRANFVEVTPPVMPQPIVSQPYFGYPTQLGGMNFYQVIWLSTLT